MDDTNKKNKKLTLLVREDKLIEVELLMLKGIQNPSKIAKKIKVSFPTAKAYIEAVQMRQRKINADLLGEMKADLVERSRELEEGYWEAVKTADNSSARVGALNGILAVHQHQAWLVGLDKINK